MGIIIHESYLVDSNSGLSLKDIYINLGDVVITRNKNINGYSIFYISQYYFNKQARIDNKVPLLNHSKTVECLHVPKNIYDYVYTDIKSNFSSYSDD